MFVRCSRFSDALDRHELVDPSRVLLLCHARVQFDAIGIEPSAHSLDASQNSQIDHICKPYIGHHRRSSDINTKALSGTHLVEN